MFALQNIFLNISTHKCNTQKNGALLVIGLEHTPSLYNNFYVICSLVIVEPIRSICSMYFFENMGLYINYHCEWIEQ